MTGLALLCCVSAGHAAVPEDAPSHCLAPIDYRPGYGLSLADGAFTLGGVVAAEALKPEGEAATLELDGVSLLLFARPHAAIEVFSELEIGGLFATTTDDWEIESKPELELERLFASVRASDLLALSLGKLRTPVGRWNLVHAEPLTWTTSDPLIAEIPFDDTVSGIQLSGSGFAEAGTLEYWLYAQVVDPIDPGTDPGDPAAVDRAIGARIQATRPDESWSVGLSALVSERDGDWHYLGGADGMILVPGGLELSAELLVARGELEERDLWGAYLQAVHELIPSVFAVGRGEYLHPFGPEPEVGLLALGLAWTPWPNLRIKADYRFTSRTTTQVSPGLSSSISMLF